MDLPPSWPLFHNYCGIEGIRQSLIWFDIFQERYLIVWKYVSARTGNYIIWYMLQGPAGN